MPERTHGRRQNLASIVAQLQIGFCFVASIYECIDFIDQSDQFVGWQWSKNNGQSIKLVAVDTGDTVEQKFAQSWLKVAIFLLAVRADRIYAEGTLLCNTQFEDSPAEAK